MKQIFLFFLMQRYNFFRHPAILFLHFLLNTSLLLIYIKSTTMFTIKNMRHIAIPGLGCARLCRPFQGLALQSK